MLELLDGDALPLVGLEPALRQEHEPVRALPDLPHQIVLLQPLRLLAAAAAAAAVASVSHLSISITNSIEGSRVRGQKDKGRLLPSAF